MASRDFTFQLGNAGRLMPSAIQRPSGQRNMARLAEQAVHQHEFAYGPAYRLNRLLSDHEVVVEQGHMRREPTGLAPGMTCKRW